MKTAKELREKTTKLNNEITATLNVHLNRIQKLAEQMFAGKKQALASVVDGFHVILPEGVTYNEHIPDLGQGHDMITGIHTTEGEIQLEDATGQPIEIVVLTEVLTQTETIDIIEQLEKIKTATDIKIG